MNRKVTIELHPQMQELIKIFTDTSRITIDQVIHNALLDHFLINSVASNNLKDEMQELRKENLEPGKLYDIDKG